MNKLRLPFLLLLFLFFAFIIQSCNKDAVISTAYSTAPYQANINGSVWAPDTISNTIAYSAAAKTKTFSISGTKQAKQVIFTVTLQNAGNTPGFTPGTYNIDSLNVTAQYNTQQLVSGSYVFLPHGSVGKGAGSIIVTTVDSVKKQITGTFSFYSRSTTYDNLGNVLSITVDNITGGEFTNLPYIFTSN